MITGINSNGFVSKGIQAGVNRQMGAWVEAWTPTSAKAVSTDRRRPRCRSPGSATGTDTLTESDNFELPGSARARVGYVARPDVLIYGTGGRALDANCPGHGRNHGCHVRGHPCASLSTNVNWELGWVAGLGVEARLWNSNPLGRLEYLHYDFGDPGSSFDDSGVTFLVRHLTTDVVRAGLSYKFDLSDPVAGPARMAMPVKAMPVKALPVMASNWSGFYVGGHVGYVVGPRSDERNDLGQRGSWTTLIGTDPIFPSDINSNGYVAGFQAGVNRQMGSSSPGRDRSSATGIKGSTTNIDLDHDDAQTPGDKLDMLGSARARFGYLALPNVLFYGTGGLGWTRVSQSFVEVTTTGVSGSTFPAWEFGWVAGAGAETMLWNSNWLPACGISPLRLRQCRRRYRERGRQHDLGPRERQRDRELRPSDHRCSPHRAQLQVQLSGRARLRG